MAQLLIIATRMTRMTRISADSALSKSVQIRVIRVLRVAIWAWRHASDLLFSTLGHPL